MAIGKTTPKTPQRLLTKMERQGLVLRKKALETASLGETPRSLTVVSSADGTKVLKNIDTLITKYENSATQPKTFLVDVAKW